MRHSPGGRECSCRPRTPVEDNHIGYIAGSCNRNDSCLVTPRVGHANDREGSHHSAFFGHRSDDHHNDDPHNDGHHNDDHHSDDHRNDDHYNSVEPHATHLRERLKRSSDFDNEMGEQWISNPSPGIVPSAKHLS